MNEATVIGVDLAKNVFQLYGAAADGTVVYYGKPFIKRQKDEAPVEESSTKPDVLTLRETEKVRRQAHPLRQLRLRIATRSKG